MARQAMFRTDGTTTDVPSKNTEYPQLEKQLDLFQHATDKENLERLLAAGRSKTEAKSSLRLVKRAQELGLMSKHPGKFQCPRCGKWLSISSHRGHKCK